MTVLEGLFLGLLQGFTEFLPISSSGHLVLFGRIFDIPSNVTFDLMLHFGTLLSILVFYRKEILSLFKPPFKNLLFLALATLPAIVAMLLFRSFFENLFSGKFLSFSFIFTAMILIFASRKCKKKGKVISMNASSALFMGIFQSVAIIPGISRSGMTISAGIFSGVEREEVSSFSFLMSIPIILGSIIVSLFEGLKIEASFSVSIISIMAAFVGGYFSLKLVVNLVKKIKLHYFSYYLIPLGIACLFLF